MSVTSYSRFENLLSLDAEAGWTAEEATADNGTYHRLHSYFLEVLTLLGEAIPGITHSYVAIAGPKCGFLTAIAAIGRNAEELPATPTSGTGTLAAAYLLDTRPIILIKDPALDPRFVGDKTIREKLLIKLEAHGESYGFISLDSRSYGVFTSAIVEELAGVLPFLQRATSDAIFTCRLRLLAGPFESWARKDGVSRLHQQIADRATQGFACDGSILRLHDPSSGLLEVRAYQGDVDSYFLEPVEPGDRIAGRVFSDHDRGWSLGSLGMEQESLLTGIAISSADADKLYETGIKSYIVMRLVSESLAAVGSNLQGTVLGTLAIFHRRPHRFSWRDLGLFRGFCQRVADTLALHQKNVELEELAETLRLQGQMITRVEVVALLAHDLGHKSFEACQNVHAYIDACRKALNSSTEKRSHTHLEDRAELALSSAESIQHSLEQIRKLFGGAVGLAGEKVEFSVETVIKEVESMMAGGLERYKVQVKRTFTGNVSLRGYRSILTQVLLNLVINSVDAIRAQKNRKPTAIHVHAHEERQGGSRRIIIQFWDEGPGINRTKFPNPQEIFQIGKTSKETGTGTGLPVARSLLGQYFTGDLVLEDADTARFRISIPA